MNFTCLELFSKSSDLFQALQIIGYVVAEFYANKRSLHGRTQFLVSNATLPHEF
jgi:hypothetical protein